MDVQMQIRRNANAMASALEDLYSWETDIVDKDTKLKTTDAKGNVAPIRGGGTTTSSKKKGSKKAGKKKKKAGKAEAAASVEQAADDKKDWKSGSMKDYYSKWDTYDEDEELVVKEGGKEEEKSGKPSKGKGKPVSGPGAIGGTAGSLPGLSVPKPTRIVETAAAVEPAPEPDVTSPVLEKAIVEKDKGNEYYREARHGEAVAAYTRAIATLCGAQGAKEGGGVPLQAAKDQQRATTYCNRAMAHLRLSNWELAEADASNCLDLDPLAVKAYMRRANARREMHRYTEAVGDWEKLLKIEPANKNAIRELASTIELASKFRSSSRGKGKGGNSKGGLVLTFDKGGKRVEKTWRVRIPVRSVSSAPSPADTARVAKAHEAMDAMNAAAPAPTRKPVKMDPRAVPVVSKTIQVSNEPPPLPAAPKTGYELERHLKTLRNHPALMKQFLLAIPSAGLPRLLQHCLTTELVLKMAAALGSGEAGEEEEEAQEVLRFTTALGKTSRFDVTMMFLGAAESAVLEKMFGRMEAGLSQSDPSWATKAALPALRTRFGLK